MKQHELHGKFSNFKSVSQNVGDFEDYEYFFTITVGTPQQVFTVILNLTSGNLVVPDINCGSCNHVKRFDPSKSSTYQKTNYYLSNNSSHGVYGQDFVRIGNTGGDQLVIPNSMFGQTLTRTGIMAFDGIMGLGFTAENPDGVDSPIITAVKSGILDYPVVTLFFRGVGYFEISDKGGVATFGAVDTVNCDRNVIYEPSTDPNKFQISLKKASLGSSQFSGNWNAVLTTNYIVLIAPQQIVEAFAKEVNATSYDGTYYIDCNTKLNLELTIGNTVYTLTEKQMLVSDDEGGCLFALYPSTDDTWALGDPWLQGFCNILDYGNKRIGFANITSS